MIPTQSQYDLMLKNTRDVHIMIHLLDYATERQIDTLQGVCIGGSITISADSNCRRVANVEFVTLDETYHVGMDRKIWVNRKIKIFVGLKPRENDSIEWFDMGNFIINNPSFSFSNEDNTLSFEALDYMSLLDGTLDGSLRNYTEIPVGLNISEAFRSIAADVGNVTKLNIASINDVVPYTIKKDATASVYDLLKEINELYMSWEFFFDSSGYLTFQQVRDTNNDIAVWDFTQTPKLLISYNNEFEFSNIRNIVQVWGRTLSNGEQIKYLVSNTDANNPFNVNAIGEREFTYSDTNLYTNDQAQARAEFELKNHSNFNEKISINCVPIYSLGVNQLIEFQGANDLVKSKYIIKNIQVPLTYDGTMSIECYKVYNNGGD